MEHDNARRIYNINRDKGVGSREEKGAYQESNGLHWADGCAVYSMEQNASARGVPVCEKL